MPTLFVLGGLPGTGKSAIARALASTLGATWLRIDSIEQAIRSSALAPEDVQDAGYQTAYAVAGDNLRLGRDVIADSVNPWMRTRDAWRDIGLSSGATVLEVEVICSDVEEHRRRVGGRSTEVQDLKLPDWAAIQARDYHRWTREHLVIDTAALDPEACAEAVMKAMAHDPS